MALETKKNMIEVRKLFSFSEMTFGAYVYQEVEKVEKYKVVIKMED